jgi:hypothetical protein
MKKYWMLLFLMWSGCQNARPVPICFDLASDETAAAIEGIGRWGNKVTKRTIDQQDYCVATVQKGSAPNENPNALGSIRGRAAPISAMPSPTCRPPRTVMMAIALRELLPSPP